MEPLTRVPDAAAMALLDLSEETLAGITSVLSERMSVLHQCLSDL